MSNTRPPLEITLTRALDEVTPSVDPSEVALAVEHRRLRRRTAQRQRRVRVAGAALVGAAACVIGLVVVRTDRIDRLDSTGTATAADQVHERADTDGQGAAAPSTVVAGLLGTTLVVPGEGSRVVGLAAGEGDGFWIARGDPLDATDPVGTTITQVLADGTFGAESQIAGVPLFATRLGDELLVVAEDRVTSATDPTRFRLKRVDAASGEVLSSTPLQLVSPMGVRTVDGQVQVQDRTGSVEVDPVTGQSTPTAAGSFDLSSVDQVLDTDGVTWVRTISDGVGVAVHEASVSGTIALAGAGPLVAASSWGPHVVATTVQGAGGVDLIELAVGDVGDAEHPDRAPTSRVRLDGLPDDAALVDVWADRVWLVLGEHLAALPLH